MEGIKEPANTAIAEYEPDTNNRKSLIHKPVGLWMFCNVERLF